MKLPVGWLRDFVDVQEPAADVATRYGLCGFAVESVDGDVIDLEITANRPDAMSVFGLAREASAIFGRALRPGPTDSAADASGPSDVAPVPVSIDDPRCGRYALAVADVKVGPSPSSIASRLAACGVRPINNVVDITNYVMLELGQPMHAFDAAKLAGPQIHVRAARTNETLTTLDGQTRTMPAGMLVIADRDRPIAVAGVMGGAASEVSAGTTRVALESAWFRPAAVREASRALGLKTEASMRFERGADPEAAVAALRRALTLLEETGAGRAVGGVTDLFPVRAEARTVVLRRTRLATLLGDRVADDEVTRILGRLGFMLSLAPEGWQVVVPSFRVDIRREVDLVEEVGRHRGFDRIPATFPALATTPRLSDPGVPRGRLVRRVLCGAGLQEAVTFTFLDAAAAAPFAGSGLVTLQNALSEKFSVLRPSLAPGLVDAVIYNRNRQAEDVRLFEVGTVFSPAGGEQTVVGWALAGSRGAHWSGTAGPIDFSDAKGVAELLATVFATSLDVRDEPLPWLIAGQRASLVTRDGQRAGWIGRSADVRLDREPVFVGEVALDALARASAERPARVAALPRHPSVVRDLSIFVDERLPAADVRGTIRSNAPATLASINEFDRYQGKGVPQGQVSLSIRLTFRDANRTLTDAEVQQSVDAIVAALRTQGATLRGA